jgi:L-alanine-DL-glutamate epimerase-like enolase superfamily enzyme
VKIQSLEAIPLNIGFKQLFQFGLINRKASQNVILKITTDEGLCGYGEACPVPAFTAETQQSVVANLTGRVAPLILGKEALDHEPLIRTLERFLPHCPFTLTAVDLALWDIAGKAANLSVTALLGGKFRDKITMHGSVGWGEPESMIETAQAQLDLGYTALKLYAGRGNLDDDLKRLERVRAAIPKDIQLLVDVNGLWNVTDCLKALPRLAAIGVIVLEQPLPAWDKEGQAEIVRRSSIDLAADESVYQPYDVLEVGRRQSARVINLGLSKLGGLLRSRECATIARAFGLKVMVGSVLELGIATAGGLHLAASLPDLPYPNYLVGPLKYEQDVVLNTIEVNQGQIAVPTGPGLGVEVDEALLKRLDARAN